MPAARCASSSTTRMRAASFMQRPTGPANRNGRASARRLRCVASIRRAGQLDEPSYDVEPEPRAGHRAAQLVAEPVKLLEDHPGVLGREARGRRREPRGRRPRSCALASTRSNRPSPAMQALTRVVEQIAQDRLERGGSTEIDRFSGTSMDDRRCRRAARARRPRRLPHSTVGWSETTARHGAMSAFLEPRRVEQVVDHPQQPLAVLEYALGRAAAYRLRASAARAFRRRAACSRAGF